MSEAASTDEIALDGATASASSLWRNVPYMYLLVGESVSQLGRQLAGVAIPIIAVLYLSATEFQVGLLGAAQMAAFLIIGLPAGAWVDRLSKRKVMIWANVVRTALMTAVPLLWLLDMLEMSVLMAVSLLAGICAVFFDVAYMSIVPALVARDQLAAANSRLEGSFQAARLGGPALGGMLTRVMSAPLLIFGTAAGYLASAIAISRIPAEPSPVRDRDSRLWHEIRDGWHFVVRHPLISRLVLATGLSNLFGTIAGAMMAVAVLRHFALGEVVFGALITAGAVGGVAGAFAGSWIIRKTGEGHAIVVNLIATVVGAFIMVAAFYVPESWVIVVIGLSQFVFGFTIMSFNISQVSVRQKLCPPALLGRMNASIRFVIWGCMPISSVISGLLAARFDLVTVFWVGALGELLAIAVLVTSPLWKMRVVPEPEWALGAS